MSQTRRAPGLHRYQRIAQQLNAEIHRGRYRVGQLLPTELELCERFHASRYTVREALRALTDKGLIVRRPRAGSVVIASEPASVFTQSVGSITEMLNYPADTYREVKETGLILTSATLATLLKCAPGTQWFCIRGLRRSPGIALPICWTDFYIRPEYADIVKRRDHARLPVFRQIEAQYGVRVERAHLDVFASSVPPSLAGSLKVKRSTPALTIVRHYFSATGEYFEATVSIHPANRFTYSIDLVRELRGHGQPIRPARTP